MSNLDSKIILEKNKLLEEFKGSFTENYVASVLNYLLEKSSNYYTFDRNENYNKISFRFSLNNISKDGKIINI